MAENKNAQQVREITDKLEQGIKELFESERFKEYLRTMSKFYNYFANNSDYLKKARKYGHFTGYKN